MKKTISLILAAVFILTLFSACGSSSPSTAQPKAYVADLKAGRRALTQLEKVDMLGRLHHYPRHLSGGQQQRVAIARALAMEPKLLLMDEPTSALDPELVGEILVTIRKAAQEGNTCLLVTHEMNFVKSVASRIVFLENGKIVAQGAPREIFENPQNERLKQFLYKINMLESMEYVI